MPRFERKRFVIAVVATTSSSPAPAAPADDELAKRGRPHFIPKCLKKWALDVVSSLM